MSQRSAMRGSTIKATTHVYGTINAEKCIAYLRGVGVEIDDATADAWLDIQGVHRFLKSEKTSIRTGWLCSCRCGEMKGFKETGFRSAWARQRKKQIKTDERPPARCGSCGGGFSGSSRVYDVQRDGSYRDYRDADERWQPIAEYVAEMSAMTTDYGEDSDDE